MDTLNFIFGATLGIVIAWTFFNASGKQRKAKEKLEELQKIQREISDRKQKVVSDKKTSRSETVQSFFLYGLGFTLLLLAGVVFFYP